MPELIVVGTVAFDSIETPFGKRERVLGGSASYFSYAASFFTKVGLVGIVGADFPRELLAPHKKRGIDTSGLVCDSSGKTFFWSGSYEGDMNSAKTLETRLNVFADFAPVIPADYRDAPFVFLANSHPLSQLSVLDQVDKDAFVCCDSMNYWIDSANESLREVLSRVDGFFCNDAEARMLAKTTNLIHAGRKLLTLGPKFVTIKKGEHGAILFHREGLCGLPAYPSENVMDPTGAGDSFAGGFMGTLARAGRTDLETMREALVYGTNIASYAVEGFSLESLLELTDEKIALRREQILAYLPRIK